MMLHFARLVVVLKLQRRAVTLYKQPGPVLPLRVLNELLEDSEIPENVRSMAAGEFGQEFEVQLDV